MTIRKLGNLFIILLFSLIVSCKLSDREEFFEIDYSLALTPPMGWNSWNTFYKNIHEDLIIETADAIVSSGMAAAGYEYIIIDDGWASYRDEYGNIHPDSTKFPSGIKYLADYVHSKGLKFGIYSSAGTTTCGKLPGSWTYEEKDAQQYADWGVDYLKYDWCGHKTDSAKNIYKKMSIALAQTGRPIVFSICEWGDNDPWNWGQGIGHLWRTTYDIGQCWEKKGNLGFTDIIDAQVGLEQYSGPGGWNDPDMLRIGNKCLTYNEQVAHFSFWSLLNAPLMAGNDVRNMSDEVKGILTNNEVIEINQDKLGKQGFKYKDDGDFEYWKKELVNGSMAIILFNRSEEDKKMIIDFNELGMVYSELEIRDLWEQSDLILEGDQYAALVPTHSIKFFRLDRIRK